MRNMDQPYRLTPVSPQVDAVLALVRSAFACMDGLIDPPSSVHRLDAAAVRRQASEGEIWLLGRPPVACVFLTPGTDHLYLGKLAVAEAARGRGLARRLVDVAAERARALGLPAVELRVRVELTANHAVFERLGFRRVGAGAHPGFDRPTSYHYRLEPGRAAAP